MYHTRPPVHTYTLGHSPLGYTQHMYVSSLGPGARGMLFCRNWTLYHWSKTRSVSCLSPQTEERQDSPAALTCFICVNQCITGHWGTVLCAYVRARKSHVVVSPGYIHVARLLCAHDNTLDPSPVEVQKCTLGLRASGCSRVGTGSGCLSTTHTSLHAGSFFSCSPF